MNATEKKLKRLDIDEVLQMARQIKKLEESSNKSGLAACREAIRHWSDKNLATVLEELLAAREVTDAAANATLWEQAVTELAHPDTHCTNSDYEMARARRENCKRSVKTLAERYRKEWLCERS